jgi:hypothetical protein
MPPTKKCNHIPEIFCKTIFGSKDSVTEIWCQCQLCTKKTEVLSHYGWPADKSFMRKTLNQFQGK